MQVGSAMRAIGTEYPTTLVNDLTWQGNDFLSATRELGVWEKAKRSILDKAVPLQ